MKLQKNSDLAIMEQEYFAKSFKSGKEEVTEPYIFPVNGKDVLSYSWNLAVEGSTTANRAFVDPANGAPTRMETDVTASGAVTNVVVDYTYDPAVTITAPAM